MLSLPLAPSLFLSLFLYIYILLPCFTFPFSSSRLSSPSLFLPHPHRRRALGAGYSIRRPWEFPLALSPYGAPLQHLRGRLPGSARLPSTWNPSLHRTTTIKHPISTLHITYYKLPISLGVTLSHATLDPCQSFRRSSPVLLTIHKILTEILSNKRFKIGLISITCIFNVCKYRQVRATR